MQKEELESAIANGMIVFDTNALLHLYGYHGESLDSFFEVLEKIATRVFIPYQVMDEFWRNRRTTLADNSSRHREKEEIKAAAGKIEKLYSAWYRRTISRDNAVTNSLKNVQMAVDSLVAHMDKESTKTQSVGPDTPTHEDPVLTKLSRLFSGRVGSPPATAEERKLLQEQGLRRIAAKIPPGYEDAGKGDARSTGDFLVWHQTMEEAKKRQMPVVFVTQDNKQDWWLYAGTGEQRARPELVQELLDRAGQRLFIIRTTNLLEFGDVLGVHVAPNTLEQARELDTKRATHSLSNRSGVWAEGYREGDAFVVVAGVTRTKEYDSLRPRLVELRSQLIRDGYLVRRDDTYLDVAKPYSFSSWSTAAAVMLGHSASGPEQWKSLADGDGDATSEPED